MPRKVFEGFTPFDAEDVNEFLMDQSIMSFADSTARGSAIPTPSDGMASWLQDSDTFTIYNGSSWANPTPTPTLVHLSSTTFSAVASHSVNSVFSSTYTNYKILVNISSSSVNANSVRLRLRTGTTNETASVYENGEYIAGVAAGAIGASQTNSVLRDYGQIGQTQLAVGFGAEVTMLNPFATGRTNFYSLGAGGSLEASGIGTTVTTSYDGFTIFVPSGTFVGQVTVYGIRES